MVRPGAAELQHELMDSPPVLCLARLVPGHLLVLIGLRASSTASEACEYSNIMGPKKAKAKKKSTGDDKGNEKVCFGGACFGEERQIWRNAAEYRNVHCTPVTQS